jgi:hypothetical protein
MKTSEISAALRSKGGFECLEEGGVALLRGGAQLKLLGRAPNEKMWKPVRNRLQLAARQQRSNEGSPSWTVDISRWYFLLEDTETEVFAWRVLLQGVNSSIEEHFPEILRTILVAPVVAAVDVMEFPIPSSNRRDLSTSGGKRGASAISDKGGFRPGRG